MDQIVQTPISPSPNDADLFSSGTGGDTTCQPCLQGLTALPDSISLVWFYLSAHTMENNQQLVYANHKGREGERGVCERETDTKRDSRRVELPGEASMSITGWELGGIFSSEGVASCGSCPCNHPKGPRGSADVSQQEQRLVTWVSHVVFLMSLRCEHYLSRGGRQCRNTLSASVFLYSMSEIEWLPFPFQPRMDRPLVYWSGQGIKPSKAYLKDWKREGLEKQPEWVIK